MFILTTLKQTATFNSAEFILLSVVVWFLLRYVWPRHRRVATVWISVMLALLLFFSLPVVARALSASLIDTHAPSRETFNRLFVLDGDNRNGRVRQAAKEWSSSRPEIVYVLGSEWLLQAVQESGVPEDRVKSIWPAYRTREQMELVAGLMTQEPTVRFALIASGLQMPRIRALARALGLRQLTLIVSPIDDSVEMANLKGLVPSGVALSISRDSLYEHVALAYYRWHGWIDEPASTASLP